MADEENAPKLETILKLTITEGGLKDEHDYAVPVGLASGLLVQLHSQYAGKNAFVSLNSFGNQVTIEVKTVAKAPKKVEVG